MSAELEREGRVWFRRALSSEQLASLDTGASHGMRAGARLSSGSLNLSAVNKLANQLLPRARPVRVVAFNKSEDNNWTLPWHQDRVVALEDRIETSGFHNWTRKSGVWHAEPPIALLKNMLFARVHLDPATVENGCLRIALGTHLLGLITASNVAAVAADVPNEDCLAERGDVLFAKALILHRSTSSQTSQPRRAIRIDYCNEALPAPLAWVA